MRQRFCMSLGSLRGTRYVERGFTRTRLFILLNLRDDFVPPKSQAKSTAESSKSSGARMAPRCVFRRTVNKNQESRLTVIRYPKALYAPP